LEYDKHHLSKIDDIKIKLHRRIEETIKAVLIKKSGNERYAIVHAEPEPKTADLKTKSVGIDVGLMSFVVEIPSSHLVPKNS
jgi:putative transposase